MESIKQSTKQQSVKESQHENNKDKQKQKQKMKIHKGIYIANQRRKGRGGRIKSNSIDNKIQVRMKRDIEYLHKSQVEWIEINRFNKQKINKKDAKKIKYKLKEEEHGQDKQKKKKYVLKEQKVIADQIQLHEQKNKDSNISNLQIKETQQTHCQMQIKNESQSNIENNKQQQRKINQEQISSESSLSQDQKEKDEIVDKQISTSQKNKKNGQQQQHHDIIIIAQIKKEISNPFWKKPFVAVLKFQPINRPKQKYQQKNINYIHRILDDFYLDFHPINLRLPISQLQQTQISQKILEEYVKNHITINQNQKGGKIRNKILDQFQCLYCLVRFKKWRNGRAFVQLLKIIGKARTIEGECNCYLYEYELNNLQYKQSKQNPINLQLNISNQHKIYQQMIFTIDPQSSIDLDDGISIKHIQNNLYQIGIHISDVSSYLNTISRQDIITRTTSVYLPNFTYHMLPEYLVNICSLNPGVKRLAFSAFVKMNDDGQVLSSRIQKNVLVSRFKLSYQQANNIINDKITYEQFNKLHGCTELEYGCLVEKLKLLTKIGLAHRSKRLTFEIFTNDEIVFEFDEQKWPIGMSFNKKITSQNVVEEFMVIANEQIAKKEIQINPKNALIIYHPPPSQHSVRQFNQYFGFMNYKIKFDDSLGLQNDLINIRKLQNISQEIKQLCFFKARRIQQTASYQKFINVLDVKGNLHFALGLKYYTHFTSPMRRIADILVHQAINPIKNDHNAQFTLLDSQIQLANWGRQGTKRLTKDIREIYMCLMVYRTKKPIETFGIVSSYGMTSLTIFIPKFNMDKQCIWKDLNIDKIFRNKQDNKKLDVVVYYDRKSAKRDIIWVLEVHAFIMQKFVKIPVKIRCSNSIPLKIILQFEVMTNKGIQVIKYRIKND